jgi:hypothetical protein
MTEDGILGIMKRGDTYQVRYASYNPYGLDRSSYQCSDKGTLVTLLRPLWAGSMVYSPSRCRIAERGVCCPAHCLS